MTDVIRFAHGEFVHLGLGSTTRRLPRHTGSFEWYERYEAETVGDGAEGRLVSWHTFSESWDTWEMHPNGSELVVCLSGEIDLLQELDGETRQTRLVAGEAVVNEPGVWHTADVPDPDRAPTVVFVTAGQGTQLRPR